MNIIGWEPLREFDDFFNRYGRMSGRSLFRGDHSEWSPTANISETEKEYTIKAELPEVKREDVKVTLENGVITISGERKQEKQAKDENEIRVESYYGSFSRSFSLPDNVDAQSVHAESKDGMLKVHIPKTYPSKPQCISVKVQ